jgi:hypothetical protein
MPYTDTTPALPFSGRTPISRHNSYKAAVAAQAGRGAKTRRYLDWLREVGDATDHGAAECLGWPLSSVCSIRNALVDDGLVVAVGSQMGRYNRSVTVWRARSRAAAGHRGRTHRGSPDAVLGAGGERR